MVQVQPLLQQQQMVRQLVVIEKQRQLGQLHLRLLQPPALLLPLLVRRCPQLGAAQQQQQQQLVRVQLVGTQQCWLWQSRLRLLLLQGRCDLLVCVVQQQQQQQQQQQVWLLQAPL
jgi:hypothetical protein